MTGAFLVPSRDRGKGKENSFPGLLRDTDDDDDGGDDDDGTYIIPKLIFVQLILFLIYFYFFTAGSRYKSIKI